MRVASTVTTSPFTKGDDGVKLTTEFPDVNPKEPGCLPLTDPITIHDAESLKEAGFMAVSNVARIAAVEEAESVNGPGAREEMACARWSPKSRPITNLWAKSIVSVYEGGEEVSAHPYDG